VILKKKGKWNEDSKDRNGVVFDGRGLHRKRRLHVE
jgi:hypothetical protein